MLWIERQLRLKSYERMFPSVDRAYELENLRRSIVMLPPGSQALSREDAVALIAELQETGRRLRALRAALRQVMAGDEG
jgi:hypothetical protein